MGTDCNDVIICARKSREKSRFLIQIFMYYVRRYAAKTPTVTKHFAAAIAMEKLTKPSLQAQPFRMEKDAGPV